MENEQIIQPRIDGLALYKLKQIGDERGAVYHFFRKDANSFNGFGEVYFSRINENIVKGWKYHKTIFQNFCVPFGAVKIVVFDDRVNSKTKGLIDVILLDDDVNYRLLTMPPRLWYSFQCVSKDFALLGNVINDIHQPSESNTLPIDTKEIPYEWS
ncbi:MAG: dTDP-4-dehydrorhamnose epimerase [Sediminibacterium sp.]|nr:dTDP-4-dehydrorhamnose epimerase [Sediminibacterium sp.]